MVKPSDPPPPPRRYSRALQMMCTDDSVAYQSGLLSLVEFILLEIATIWE